MALTVLNRKHSMFVRSVLFTKHHPNLSATDWPKFIFGSKYSANQITTFKKVALTVLNRKHSMFVRSVLFTKRHPNLSATDWPKFIFGSNKCASC